MKKYLLAALVVVSAPLFAADDGAWFSGFAGGCFGASFDAAQIAAFAAAQTARRTAGNTLANLAAALQEQEVADDQDGAGDDAEAADSNGTGGDSAEVTALKRQLQVAQDEADALRLQAEFSGGAGAPAGLRRRHFNGPTDDGDVRAALEREH